MSKALSWLSRDGHLIDIRDNIEDIPFRQKLSESLNPSISIETQWVTPSFHSNGNSVNHSIHSDRNWGSHSFLHFDRNSGSHSFLPFWQKHCESLSLFWQKLRESLNPCWSLFTSILREAQCIKWFQTCSLRSMEHRKSTFHVAFGTMNHCLNWVSMVKLLHPGYVKPFCSAVFQITVVIDDQVSLSDNLNVDFCLPNSQLPRRVSWCVHTVRHQDRSRDRLKIGCKNCVDVFILHRDRD